jgi:hypothetical protein
VVLFTLAEQPPERDLPGILVYHLPHLVDDLIAPSLVQGPEIGVGDPVGSWAARQRATGKAAP